jgi:hypothetical protein
MGEGGIPSEAQVLSIMREEGARALKKALSHQKEAWLTLAAPSRRTGTYMRSIHVVVLPTGPASFDGHVQADAPYAEYLEEGTGLYGPSHARIYPTSGSALKFPTPGDFSHFRLTGVQRSGRRGANAKWAYAKSTAGMRARHFGRDAVAMSRAKFDEEINAGAERIAARVATAGLGGLSVSAE